MIDQIHQNRHLEIADGDHFWI